MLGSPPGYGRQAFPELAGMPDRAGHPGRNTASYPTSSPSGVTTSTAPTVRFPRRRIR